MQSPAAPGHSAKCLFCQVAYEDLTVLCACAAAGWGAGEGTSPCGSQGAQQLASWLSGHWGVFCYNCGFLWLFLVLSHQWATVFLEPHPRQGQALRSPRATVGHSARDRYPKLPVKGRGWGRAGHEAGTCGFQ